MNLGTEIKRIITSINPSWTDLEKTRFVYLEVGKMIEKNAEFFLTQSGKLEKNALSNEEMDKINKTSINIFENEEW